LPHKRERERERESRPKASRKTDRVTLLNDEPHRPGRPPPKQNHCTKAREKGERDKGAFPRRHRKRKRSPKKEHKRMSIDKSSNAGTRNNTEKE
jgi:hypothetical protein